MRRRIMNVIEDDICAVDRQPLYAESGKGELGQILLYNDNKLIFVDKENLDSYPSATPVGVVVIPASHDVYETKEAGVMSLVPMNYSTPDTGGTSEQAIYWGYNSLDIEDLPNLNVVGGLGTMNNSAPADTIQGTTSSGYLPSDKGFTGKNCPHDAGLKYYSSTSSSYSYLPSPYLTDGSRNPLYYQTESPSSELNALADFDGITNTCILTHLATSQSSWKTDTSIQNSYSKGYYPAACCCWRYKVNGIEQGYWYLPACGELGYIMPRFNVIQASIQAVIDTYSVGVQLNTSSSYWSSSEYSNTNARGVYTSSGYVRSNNKYGNYYVRAFLRVGGAS